MKSVPFAGLCLLVLAGNAQAAQTCQLALTASLDIAPEEGGRPTVPVTIEGHQESLLVDTGGVFSMLKSNVVDELHLYRGAVTEGQFVMFGGETAAEYTTANSFQLGKMVSNKQLFLIMGSADQTPGMAGILGVDIVSAYDAEFDFTNAKLNLFRYNDCSVPPIYWPHDIFAEMPIGLDRTRHILVSTMLDGQPVSAILDTGSSVSIMSLETARSIFHWNDKTPLEPLNKNINSSVKTYKAPFKTLAFGGVEVANPDIVLVSDEDTGMSRVAHPPLIVGITVLRRLHVYIAYRAKKLYVTPAAAH